MSEHARLGASNSAQWLNCTKAPAMWGDRERKASAFTSEGNVAHMYAESWLLGDGQVNIGDTINVEGFDHEVTNEMAQHVYVYTDECEQQADGADWVGIEQRVHLDPLWGGAMPPEPLFGTADFLAVKGDTLILRDLKYGKGVPVEVAGNTQLRYYGIGGYFHIPDELREKIKWVDTGIVQPRAPHPDGPVRSERIHIDDLLAWATNVLVPAVSAIADDTDTQYSVGSWCRWCPASGSCEAVAKKSQEVARTTFVEQAPVAPGHLSDEELGVILDFSETLRGWLNHVMSEAMNRIDNGRVIPGWKLVPKRAIRTWTRPDDEIIQELREMGISPKDVAQVKVNTVAAVEKTLKAMEAESTFEAMKKFIDATSSGVTLAPTTDARKGVKSSRPSARETFEALDDGATLSLD